jgi:hypothetical protein
MSIDANRKEAGVNVIMFPSTFCLRASGLTAVFVSTLS